VTPLEVCDRLFNAIPAGDIETVRELYHPDVRIWHNNDGTEQTRDDNLLILRWVSRNVKDMRYEEIRRSETANGFVQQHVLRGIAPNGTPLEIPACIICVVEDGKITRLDEYMDAEHAAPLRA